MKLSELRTSDQVLADELRDPEFRAEWERTAVARALALEVLQYRVEHGLSQRGMAELLHMTQPQVARIEAGSHNPTYDTLARIAFLLDREFDLKIPPRAVASLRAKRVRSAPRVDPSKKQPGTRVPARRAAG